LIIPNYIKLGFSLASVNLVYFVFLAEISFPNAEFHSFLSVLPTWAAGFEVLLQYFLSSSSLCPPKEINWIGFGGEAFVDFRYITVFDVIKSHRCKILDVAMIR